MRSVKLVIVVIRVAHFQPPVPFQASSAGIVTDDVLERVAATPLPRIAASIALHGVRLGEVIPGTDQVDRTYVGLGLTVGGGGQQS